MSRHKVVTSGFNRYSDFGGRVLIGVSLLALLPLFIVVFLMETSLFNNPLFWGLAAIVFVSAIAMAKGITQPVKLLAQRAHEVSGGNFRCDTKELTNMTENGGIYADFAKMVRTLQELEDIISAMADGDFKKPLTVLSTDNILTSEIDRMITGLSGKIECTNMIAKGDYGIEVNVQGDNDMVGHAINNMILTLKHAAEVAGAVADGDFTNKMTVKSDKDLLARSINRMIDGLSHAALINEQQNWLKNGKVQFSEQLRGETELVTLCRRIITFIAEYLEAQIGVIYMMEDEIDLKMAASYAYTKRKSLSNEFRIGEGLVGQAALEKQIIQIDHVPDDYIVVQSGLGEAKPGHIVVIPCVYNEKVEAVVELGTFNSLTDLQLAFLADIAEVIAITIHSAKSRSNMEKLLAETQAQAEELQVQQEELRQTNEELETHTQALRASEAELQSQQEELRVMNEELEERTHDLEIQKNDIEKKNVKITRVQQDLQQKASDLEIASRYKSEFLANMSHELRTPLNSILILSQLMMDNKEANLTAKQQEFAKIINSSGTDLLLLINDILDLSKIESGKMELQMEDIDFGELTVNLEQMFRQQAEDKNLSFDIQIADVLPPLRSDPQKLQQIMRNLLSNALKFTHDGGVTVHIHPGEAGGRLDHVKTVAISIIDTGIGIAEDKHKLIFEAFQQADGTTSRKYGGTGLGLSICRELAKLLHGEITMKSCPGKGTTFTLYLPVQENDAIRLLPKENNSVDKPAETVFEKVREEAVNEVAEGDKTLLIIDDDPNFSRIVMELGQEKGFKVLRAENGEKGITLAEEYHPRGIILDIGLPGIDGWEVMKRLKDNAVTCDIPVHFISAFEKTERAQKMGAVGYLTKPVNMEKLNEVLENMENYMAQKVKKLLIIEDDDVQRKSIMVWLNDGDVETIGAATAEEGYQLLKSQSFDCLILGLGLKNISGFELLDKIKKDKNIAELPIIVYTGKELSVEEEAELKHQVNSIIIKGKRSHERLKAETMLFLHHISSNNTQVQQIRVACDQEITLKDKKILIVDDDMRNVFSLSSILEEKGMQVIAGRNGKQGLEQLDNHHDVDLVIMDIMMPEMDGYETMREIRKQEKWHKLPIIALTAKAMKDDKMKCMEAGASDYLPKPVDVNKLLSLLRVWLYQ